MKKNSIFLVLVVISFLALSSCNKNCSCTTTLDGFEDDVFSYEGLSKSECEDFQISQNELWQAAGGSVVCVHE